MKTSYFFLALLAILAAMAYVQSGIDAPAATAFTRFLALSGLFLVAVCLMIGPAAVLMPKEFANLIEARRAVGVASFVFILAHVLIVGGAYFGWDIAKMTGNDMLVGGMAAFIIVAALALTSTDWAARTLGVANWKTLQRFAYVAFVISFYHAVKMILLAGTGDAFGMNIAQAFALLVSAAAIILQFAGFYTRKKREAAAKETAKSAPAAPNAPSSGAP